MAVDQRGAGAVGRGRGFFGELDAAVREQARAGALGAGGEQRVQMRAADAETDSAGKERVDAVGGVLEADAAKGVAIGLGEGDAELGQGVAGIRHEAFAAGFVDRDGAGFDDGAGDAALAERDGGGETGGTATDDQGFSGLNFGGLGLRGLNFSTQGLGGLDFGTRGGGHGVLVQHSDIYLGVRTTPTQSIRRRKRPPRPSSSCHLIVSETAFREVVNFDQHRHFAWKRDRSAAVGWVG